MQLSFSNLNSIKITCAEQIEKHYLTYFSRMKIVFLSNYNLIKNTARIIKVIIEEFKRSKFRHIIISTTTKGNQQCNKEEALIRNQNSKKKNFLKIKVVYEIITKLINIVMTVNSSFF